MAASLKPRLLRRRVSDAEDTLRLLIAKGDVADVLPADLLPMRSAEGDRSEVTCVVEALATRGGVDRATGGHLLDQLIESWHDGEVEDVKRAYLAREATADRLIGAAEKTYEETLERLGFVAERYQRHAAAAERARMEVVGPLDTPQLQNSAALEQAASRTLGHIGACLASQTWVPPWDATSSPIRAHENPQVETSLMEVDR